MQSLLLAHVNFVVESKSLATRSGVFKKVQFKEGGKEKERRNKRKILLFTIYLLEQFQARENTNHKVEINAKEEKQSKTMHYAQIKRVAKYQVDLCKHSWFNQSYVYIIINYV